MPEVEPTWMDSAERRELARVAAEHAGLPLWMAGDKRTSAEIERAEGEG